MKNYRNKHLVTVIFCIGFIIVMFIPVDAPDYIFESVKIAAVLGISFFSGKFEAADEMVRDNLNRANKYTLYAALASLLIFSLMGDGDTENNIASIPSAAFVAVIMGLVILRSTLFLIFDRPLKDSEDQ